MGMDYRLLPQVVDNCCHSPQFVGTIHRASKLLELCDKSLKTAITLEAELDCAPQQDFHHVLHFARQRQLFPALTAAAKLPGGFHAGLPMPNPGAQQPAGIRGALPCVFDTADVSCYNHPYWGTSAVHVSRHSTNYRHVVHTGSSALGPPAVRSAAVGEEGLGLLVAGTGSEAREEG